MAKRTSPEFEFEEDTKLHLGASPEGIEALNKAIRLEPIRPTSDPAAMSVVFGPTPFYPEEKQTKICESNPEETDKEIE